MLYVVQQLVGGGRGVVITVDLLLYQDQPLTFHGSNMDRPQAVVDTEGSVHQEIEAGEEISVRCGIGLMDCEGGGLFLVLENGAGLGHVQRHLLRVSGVHLEHAGQRGVGAGHLGQPVGDV